MKDCREPLEGKTIAGSHSTELSPVTGTVIDQPAQKHAEHTSVCVFSYPVTPNVLIILLQSNHVLPGPTAPSWHVQYIPVNKGPLSMHQMKLVAELSLSAVAERACSPLGLCQVSSRNNTGWLLMPISEAAGHRSTKLVFMVKIYHINIPYTNIPLKYGEIYCVGNLGTMRTVKLRWEQPQHEIVFCINMLRHVSRFMVLFFFLCPTNIPEPPRMCQTQSHSYTLMFMLFCSSSVYVQATSVWPLWLNRHKNEHLLSLWSTPWWHFCHPCRPKVAPR